MLGDTYDYLDWIDCDDTVDINGARAGMNFNQIQKILGKRKISKTWVETPENVAYEIEYKFEKCIVFFRSYHNDGRDSEAFIMSDK